MKIKGISEIVLIVKDVKKSAKFYGSIIGLKSQRKADHEWAWFWVGNPEQKQRLALHKGKLLFEEYSPHPKKRRWGHIHYAFNVSSKNLNSLVKNIKKKGIKIYGPHYFKEMNAISYYLYDPDGNLIEFWSPNSIPNL